MERRVQQNLVTSDTSGERIRVEGRVFDGDGKPMPDCMLEIWQADAQGHSSDPADTRAQPNSSFREFGRCGTDAKGGYAFDTIKPGQVAAPWQDAGAASGLGCSAAWHVAASLYADLFRGEAGQRRRSGVDAVPTEGERTLIATREGGSAVYRLDIHMQGDNETVFFDV